MEEANESPSKQLRVKEFILCWLLNGGLKDSGTGETRGTV
jgi:hypothetical protein